MIIKHRKLGTYFYLYNLEDRRTDLIAMISSMRLGFCHSYKLLPCHYHTVFDEFFRQTGIEFDRSHVIRNLNKYKKRCSGLY